MQAIELKQVKPGDAVKLQEISRKTFSETFSESNSEADMVKYLEEGFSIEKLLEELNNEHSVFYFALFGAEVIGYLKLNFGTETGAGMEIQRIYVLKEYLGRKVGQMLYEKALEIAEKRNVPHIWLGVWEKNTKAISFYQKNGFFAFDSHIFLFGDDPQTDILMKKVLNIRR